jgi:hypothetical protein
VFEFAGRRFRLVAAALALIACGWSCSSVAAEDVGRGFKAGQKIEWRDRITDKWEPGTLVGETPGGKQPIILQRPGDVGSQTAYDWENVRTPATQQPVATAPGKGLKAGQKILWLDRVANKWTEGEFLGETPDGRQPIIRQRFGDVGTQTAYDWKDIKAATDDTSPGADLPRRNPANPLVIPPLPLKPVISGATAPGGEPLAEDEIKRFILDRVGDRPFDDPAKLRQTILELDALVKKRGTKFLYNTGLNEFGAWLSAHGFSAIGPINHNFGPPNDQNWLFGSWVTSKTGLPVQWVEGDRLITWLEIGAANTGVVTIYSNGTYRWQTDSAQGIIVGKWRAATVEEMGDQGGAGVVLEKAKNGVEWVAYKYRASNPAEEWLGLAEVNRRSIREGGIRIPPDQVENFQIGTR